MQRTAHRVAMATLLRYSAGKSGTRTRLLESSVGTAGVRDATVGEIVKPLQVIVIGLGSAGDVHPNVGLALALRQRGHEVLLVAPSVFRSLGEHAGLGFAALLSDDEYHAAIRDPNLWHPFRSFSVVARRLILPTLRPVYQIIEKHWEPGRTVVAAPGFAFGARIAQEKLGVPLATVHL